MTLTPLICNAQNIDTLTAIRGTWMMSSPLIPQSYTSEGRSYGSVIESSTDSGYVTKIELYADTMVIIKAMYDKIKEYEERLEASENIVGRINLNYWPKFTREMYKTIGMRMSKMDIQDERDRKMAVDYYMIIKRKYHIK